LWSRGENGFLGVYIDCLNRTLSLPDQKVNDLYELLKRSIRRKKMTKLEIQKLLGKLNWAARVIKGGRTFMRRLIDLTCRTCEEHHYLRLSKEAKADISWWIGCPEVFNGTCKFSVDIRLANCQFATDACETGGAVFF
jgi:hypothetical protein